METKQQESFKHHFQKNKDWNTLNKHPYKFLSANFKHHFQKNKDWNEYRITDKDIHAGFKHHFQKNKDWNMR